MDLKQFANQDFVSMPIEEQRKVLSTADPQFKNMFPVEQDKVLNTINSYVGGEIKQGPPSWISPLRETAELGAMAGAGLLSGGNPLAVGGAYAGAKGLGDIAMEMAGYRKPEDLKQKLLDTGLNVLSGATAEMGGQIAGLGLSKAINWTLSKFPFAGKGNTGTSQELDRIARRHGIEVLPPDITGNMGQSKLFQGLAMLPTSANVMQEEGAKTIKDYAVWSESIRLKYGGKASPFETGTRTAEGVALTKLEAENTMKQLYQIVQDRAKDVPVTFQNWAKGINKIQKESEYRLLPKDYKEQVDTVLGIINSEENWVYSKAEDLRRIMQNRIMSTPDKGARRMMWKAYNAFEDDMAEAAAKVGSDVHNDYLTARAFSRENVYSQFVGQGSVGKKLENMTPERLTNHMKTVSGLSEVKDFLPTAYFQKVKEGLLAEMFEESSRNVKVKNYEIRYIDPTKLENKLQSYKKEYIGKLLEPEEMDVLAEYVKLGKNLNNADRLAGNPSGTAGAWYMGQLLLTGAGGFGAGYATSDPGSSFFEKIKRGAKGAAVFLGTPYAISKLVTSNIGRNYLINGFKVSPITMEGITKPTSYITVPDWLKPTKEEAEMPK